MKIKDKLNRLKSKVKKILHVVFFGQYSYLSLCVLLPAVIMYLMYLARGIYPFGEGSVLVLDLNGQYVWFFDALRNAVCGDRSLLYSFSRALGGDFIGIYAYYLASPLSYIVCLFPEDRMLEALLTIFLIKVGISGGTFGYYMHKTEKVRSKTAIIAFSVLYSLSAYAIVQQHNTMWIDALMWLPLLSLGLESLIKEGKFKLYTFFLALTLFSNFYIGYMVCFYCFFYFFAYYLGTIEGKENNPLSERLHFLKSLLRVFLYSLLAIGMAGFILLGAYYSLSFGKTTFSTTDWTWSINFDIVDFLYKLLPGSYDTVRPDGLPFVYCGVLTLLLLPTYFLCNKISLSKKIAGASLLAVFLFCMFFSVPDLILHGFQAPNWLNYRYSFCFCFILCVMGCRALCNIRETSLKIVLGMTGFLILLCAYLQNYTSGDYVDPNNYTCILFTLVAVFLYLILLALYKKKPGNVAISIVLIVVVLGETFLNGLFCMNALDEDVVYSKYTSYNDFLDKITPIVDEVQSKDDSFYRMEKSVFRKTNDNMQLNMRGLSGSTSTLNVETIKFLNKMGYASKSHWSKYIGGTPVNDSLLGIKYIITDSSNYTYADYYTVVAEDEENDYVAYENPYALSIAYGVEDEVLDLVMGFVEGTAEQKEDAMSGFVQKLKSLLNQTLGIDEKVRTDEYEDDYNTPMERLNAIISAMIGEDVEIFVPIQIQNTTTENLKKQYFSEGEVGYTALDSDETGYLTFTITMPEDGNLYFYLPTNYPREVKISLDGKSYGTFNGNESGCIKSLDTHTKGQELKLKVQLTTTWLYQLSGVDCFYYLDWDAFESAMEKLSNDQLVIDEYTETDLHGTITTSEDNELIFTSIAYDTGWKVYVDGEETEICEALGAVIAFRVNDSAGMHEIELKYQPKILIVGGIISGVSILLFAGCIVGEKYGKNVPVLRACFGVTKKEKKRKKVREKKND